MINRGEIAGLAAAVIAHAALFALLAVGFLSNSNRPLPSPAPMEVSLVDKVALDASAPEASSEPEAAKLSPLDLPPEPEAAPKVEEPKPIAKPEPPKPAPAPDASERRRPDRSSADASSSRSSRDARPGGGIPDYAKEFGRGTRPNDSESIKPPATMTGAAAADIASAITRQVQPCADRQVNPGPGANQIVVTIRLQLDRNGALRARPEIVGVRSDEANDRYVERVKDLAIAAFVGCSPLRGLPPELYDVPRGWQNFRMNYKLPD